MIDDYSDDDGVYLQNLLMLEWDSYTELGVIGRRTGNITELHSYQMWV